MPELAEVENQRRRWDAGLGAEIRAAEVAEGKRIFRPHTAAELAAAVRGRTLLRSETSGKQMMFVFSGGGWLGVHLGMTGELRVEAADFARGRHDHLVLRQAERSLVFCDPRMFGRVRLACGEEPPEWWSGLAPALTSEKFTLERVREALRRSGRTPLKALLLRQEHFPGVGNWMADEILWRMGATPGRLSGSLAPEETETLHRETRWVAQVALDTVGVHGGDPPEGWLFHARWEGGGACPRCGAGLLRATVGGRTSCWCPVCQQGTRGNG